MNVPQYNDDTLIGAVDSMYIMMADLSAYCDILTQKYKSGLTNQKV